MQLDTEQKGLATIFRKWQVPLVEELFRRTLTSGEAHRYLKLLDIRTGGKGSRSSVSRASVIFFLNDFVDLDLIEYESKTGKGGHHRIFKMKLTREEFAHKIIDKFFTALIDTFPEESRTFPWIIP